MTTCVLPLETDDPEIRVGAGRLFLEHEVGTRNLVIFIISAKILLFDSLLAPTVSHERFKLLTTP